MCFLCVVQGMCLWMIYLKSLRIVNFRVAIPCHPYIFLHHKIVADIFVSIFSYGVMVTRQILALKIEVRALVGKLKMDKPG